MAITLGTFTKQNDGSFTGLLKTLNINANLVIVPTEKIAENAPDYRVYAGNGNRYEVGAGWSQIAKTSGETYINLKIAAPRIRAKLGSGPPRQTRNTDRGWRLASGPLGTARTLKISFSLGPAGLSRWGFSYVPPSQTVLRVGQGKESLSSRMCHFAIRLLASVKDRGPRQNASFRFASFCISVPPAPASRRLRPSLTDAARMPSDRCSQ